MKPKAVPVPLPLRLQIFAAPAAGACSQAACVRANAARSATGDVRGSLMVRARREVSS
jgi:hypothetical protein